MTRNANLIHLEARRAARYGKRARVPAIALWRQPPFFLLYVSSFFLLFFLNSLDGRRTNDWLEIYEKDRKIIPLAGDSERQELGGWRLYNVWDINGDATRILRVVNCRVTKRAFTLRWNLVKDVYNLRP